MSEGNTYDPGAMAAQSYAAFNLFGPATADILKNNFLPLSSDAARISSQNYNTYAPGMNETGRRIAEDNTRAGVALDRQLLNSPSASNIVNRLTELQKQSEPEYYRGRATAEQGLQNLFGQVNSVQNQALLPEQGNVLTGSEQAAIERGLNRINSQQGNSLNPSQQTQITNAMTFGDAGRARLMENRNENRLSQSFKPGLLSQALSSASQALPTFRTGIDPYKVVTGKSSASSFGQPVASDNTAGSQFGSQVFGGFNTNTNTALNATANNKTSAASQVAGVMGSMPSYS